MNESLAPPSKEEKQLSIFQKKPEEKKQNSFSSYLTAVG